MQETMMVKESILFFSLQKKYKLVKQEVPFLSRCIDVVLVNHSDEVISIEFKVSKWRHAIEQAKNHKLGADKSYICIPERKKSELLYEAILDAGIGLLFFNESNDEKVVEIIPAPGKQSNPTIFRDLLINNLFKI